MLANFLGFAALLFAVATGCDASNERVYPTPANRVFGGFRECC